MIYQCHLKSLKDVYFIAKVFEMHAYFHNIYSYEPFEGSLCDYGTQCLNSDFKDLKVKLKIKRLSWWADS